MYHLLLHFGERHPDTLQLAQVLIDVNNQSFMGLSKRRRVKDFETNALFVQHFDLEGRA